MIQTHILWRQQFYTHFWHNGTELSKWWTTGEQFWDPSNGNANASPICWSEPLLVGHSAWRYQCVCGQTWPGITIL
jgi:hypothetical protein